MELARRTRVLLVDDDPAIGLTLESNLTYIGYAVDVDRSPGSVIARAQAAEDWDVVLLDVGLPEISGVEVLQRLRASGSTAAVVMLTGDDSAATATTCLRAGAFHYLTKPCLPVELAQVVEAAARHAALRKKLATTAPAAATDPLIGDSPAIGRLRAAIGRLTGQHVPVLIQGESGTGKELVARALHASSRPDGPYVAVNCSALPESLIDSELFGHTRGAFTGATSDRAGVFVEADGGTLFLDEIGDMPPSVQARLLRALQEGEIRPVGGGEVRAIDVRVIAATHVNLAAAVADGRFREDLYYRLQVVTLEVPPLRERPEDVPLLVEHFLRDAGWDEAEAKTYIETILAATDHPNAVFDPRIPGAARYQDTLELYTNRVIAGELQPQEAMDQCATEFNAITDELGRDQQIAAYRAHLGMVS